MGQIVTIKHGDKLQTVRDIYLNEKIIASGTIFYVCSLGSAYQPITPTVVNGFGRSLCLAITVSQNNPRLTSGLHWTKSSFELPLDALQLFEESKLI